MRAQGKVVVVTGASMGIGEELARVFAEEGASVVLCSRDLARVEAARQRIGHTEHTLAIACDVSKRAELEKLSQATMARFGRIDVWINNTGYGLIDSVAEMKMAECRALFETNLFGAIEGMQVAAAIMKKQGGGMIINISSVAGHIAVPGMAAYSATKFALNAIGKAARLELEEHGIHVMTVCPGYIATDFGARAVRSASAKRLGVARNRIGVERVGRAVFNGYLRRKREVVVPARDRIFIFIYQRWPKLVEWGMQRALRPAEEVIAATQAAKNKS